MAGKKTAIGAVILEAGSTRANKTGGWRSFRPIIINEKCIKCYSCWKACPDNAIKVKDDGSVEVDYDYCKGCLICFNECPVKAIEKKLEEK